MKWYSYSYSEPQAVSRTSTAQAEDEYDNASQARAAHDKCRKIETSRVATLAGGQVNSKIVLVLLLGAPTGFEDESEYRTG
jgi:hypothetical protein